MQKETWYCVGIVVLGLLPIALLAVALWK